MSAPHEVLQSTYVEEGREEEAERINELNLRLLADKRQDNLIRACQDRNYQKQLLAEYGLQSAKSAEQSSGVKEITEFQQ